MIKSVKPIMMEEDHGLLTPGCVVEMSTKRRKFNMKLACLLSLSDHFRTGNGSRQGFDDTYVRTFFESTKKFLDIQLERDGYVFLKDALKVFGFRVKSVPLSDLCKVWVYKDKRSKVRVRLRKLRIRTGKDEYMTDYAVDFIVPDN